jgi:predicted transcriptional regulator
MAVLLSIRQEFSDAIWARTKRFEYRRRVFDTLKHRETFVYTTSPTSSVTGRFYIEDLLVGSPKEIWDATHSYSGIDEERFYAYYSGRSIAFALAIGSPQRFQAPLSLVENFGLTHAPQSYAFVNSPLN